MPDEDDERKIVTDDSALGAANERLSATDKDLLHSAATGEGLVTVTPAMLGELGAALRARMADIEARYPKLVEACDYETRLAITAQVFRAIVEHATEGGSYRYLIYERLGFGPDAYVPLYDAGGMTISNEFDLRERPPSRDDDLPPAATPGA